MTINECLRISRNRLKSSGLKTSDLDSILLLEHILKVDRSLLLAHPEKRLTKRQETTLAELLKRRAEHEPLAYITGYKEFYGRKFKVNNSVLIPRPETESIINILIDLPMKKGDLLLDIGAGSGNIGITAKLELPYLKTYLIDNDPKTIAVAKTNARILGAKVSFAVDDFQSWVEKLQPRFIVANLPYLPLEATINSEAAFEPKAALFAKANGLALINRLVKIWEKNRPRSSYLLLECEPWQHQEVLKTVKKSQLYLEDGYCISLHSID